MPHNKKSGPKKTLPKKSTKKKSPKPPKPAPPTPRPNTKITGERSEAAFLAHALQLDLAIAKPWGDSRRYDFIIDNGARLWRVQTKCTECLRADAYETRATYTVGKTRAVYTRADIDFLAAHVVPLDVWYIIPVEVCTPAPMLRMYPHRKAKKMRLEKYRNAWFLLKLKDSPEDGPITIQASADEADCSERNCGVDTPFDKLRASSVREARSLWLVIPNRAEGSVRNLLFLAGRLGRK
ncbi:MAG TPA: group I intron-associated PD-(D/E)XK endonuclease [Terriglobales bacterium]|nr:group I intron-associated PD-(D/E)XK endonuclease [Terriglobales bacterium]